MHIVFANIHALPERREDYLQALLTHAENTRAEPGCVRFDVLQDNDDPNCFRLYEVYQTRQHMTRMGRTPASQQRWKKSLHGKRSLPSSTLAPT